jgi:hypothetical protein
MKVLLEAMLTNKEVSTPDVLSRVNLILSGLFIIILLNNKTISLLLRCCRVEIKTYALLSRTF